MKQRIDIPKDTKIRERHGLPWDPPELHLLLIYWDETQMTLLEICDKLQRPLNGVLPKLLTNGRIWSDATNTYWHDPRGGQQQPTNTEDNMKAPAIETQTFIAGVDASTLTDMQIFKKIAAIELEISQLRCINAMPRKLAETIDAMTKDIVALCRYVDAREAQE